ncbi:SusE domain-containing protein [Flavobacterium sp. Fl-77]|uniref:SusE domain-containing protein n=1 Tax=Flavobacterium flavipigmentatum TaxID=2893884 RepID=A0AAJ2S6M0_9FLAO|nr:MULTISPECIES: SusE domain-containing protein [unclassified Flavobacterium]MDX6181295.1 SusE domain-containing protein [Flavobacterium sp. Fl-33]MDX6184896.1 SusE domain-containing protein [Flavobacterium sp. Fl-77]UFH39988.1 SusE domain-containing protein [Flavobacterium sp. F-70]
MKNIYKILIAFIGVLMVSCNADDVDNRPILNDVSTPEITAPATGQNIVLDVNKAADEALKVTWSAAEYSTSVAIKYTVLIDKKGGDFSAAKTLQATTNGIKEVSILSRELNQAAIDLGGKPEVAAMYDVKISSNVSGGFVQVSKGLITITVTPYTGKVTYDFNDWYLVGDATVSGWDNNKGNQILFRSGTNANEYKFTGFYKKGYFKAIKNLGSWAPMYGGSAGTLAYRGTDSDPDPASFEIPADGYYTFTMDVQKLTYSLVPYNASAAVTYSTVGIIGSATAKGWDASTAMVKSSFSAHVWSLGVTSLNDGEMKFRANDAWDVSWGGKTAFSGGGTGDNIPVAKSKYVIYFNDLDGSYLMIPNQ